MHRMPPHILSIRFTGKKGLLVRYAFPTEKDARGYYDRMKVLATEGRIQAVRLETSRGAKQTGVLEMPDPPPEAQPCVRCPGCKDFQPRVLFLRDGEVCSFCAEAREAAAAGAREFRGMFRSLKEARDFVARLKTLPTTYRVDPPTKAHGPDLVEAWFVTWAAREEEKKDRPRPRAKVKDPRAADAAAPPAAPRRSQRR
jgi:hypothetical protein